MTVLSSLVVPPMLCVPAQSPSAGPARHASRIAVLHASDAPYRERHLSGGSWQLHWTLREWLVETESVSGFGTGKARLKPRSRLIGALNLSLMLNLRWWQMLELREKMATTSSPALPSMC